MSETGPVVTAPRYHSPTASIGVAGLPWQKKVLRGWTGCPVHAVRHSPDDVEAVQIPLKLHEKPVKISLAPEGCMAILPEQAAKP